MQADFGQPNNSLQESLLTKSPRQAKVSQTANTEMATSVSSFPDSRFANTASRSER